MNDICIAVEPMAGAGLDGVCLDMIALSKKLGIGVTASFNGIYLCAFPQSDPIAMQNGYYAQLTRKKQ